MTGRTRKSTRDTRKTEAARPRNPRPSPSEKTNLNRYHAKRDFTRTPEPAGRSPRRPRTPATLAYCIQKHLASHLHYDFRLEFKGQLLSWAVPKGPSLNPRDKRLAMRVEDHPFEYKDFEGVIPTGYGAGVVMLWDTGTWQPEPGFENIAAALDRGELKFQLQGVKLKGSWVLVRTGEKSPTGEREHWLLIKHRDNFAGDIDVTALAPLSVKTDRTFEKILKHNPETWNSAKPGGLDLKKIADKVANLQEPPPSPRRRPKK